jgi:hypothetical protein
MNSTFEGLQRSSVIGTAGLPATATCSCEVPFAFSSQVARIVPGVRPSVILLPKKNLARLTDTEIRISEAPPITPQLLSRWHVGSTVASCR